MPKVTTLKGPHSARDPRGRRALISRDKVLDAARQLSSHELTMSAVAERLGVTKASLYYHFTSRNDLLAALAGDAMRAWTIPASDSQDWRRWLEKSITGLFEMLCSNPVFLELENITHIAGVFIPLQEGAMETLEGAGFTFDETGMMWRVLASYAMTAARSIHEARHVDVAALQAELATIVTDAERSRPLPRVRAAMTKASTRNPQRIFADTLAWLVQSLPDPAPARKSGKPARGKA